jgi:hypothetical protein
MLEIADNPEIYYTKVNKWDISYLSVACGFSYETHSM